LKNEVAVIAKVEENPNVTFLPFKQDRLLLILAAGSSVGQEKKRVRGGPDG
jgi:hypothetical protein